MTKRERFLNFLENKPVDRVPVAFFRHFSPVDEWFRGLESEEIFQKNIESHRTSRKVFDPDIVKIMNDSLMFMPVDTSFVEKPSDLRKIEPPTYGSPWFEKSRELTDRVLDIYADSDAPSFATGFAPFHLLRTSLSGLLRDVVPEGKPKMVSFLEEDPESVVEAFKIMGESIKSLNTMLVKECGVDGLYFSVNNRAHYIPDDLYAKYITPTEVEIIEHANSLSNMNLLHICGNFGQANNLDLFKDYQAAAINWAVHAEGVSLGEGKKNLFGGKPVFGGFDQRGVLYKGSHEEVEAATFKILDEVGQIGVMLGADCTVPMDIDENRLEWVRQAAIKYAEQHK